VNTNFFIVVPLIVASSDTDFATRNNNEESHGVRQESNEFAASRFTACGNSEHAVQVPFMKLPTLVARCRWNQGGSIMRTLGKIAATLGVVGAIVASSAAPAAAWYGYHHRYHHHYGYHHRHYYAYHPYYHHHHHYRHHWY
jgi:hypothetical protein